MTRRALVASMLATLLGAFPGCSRETRSDGPQFGPAPDSAAAPTHYLAVHPLHNPSKLLQAYQPLVDYLNRRVRGAQFALLASRDYATYEQRYRARIPELLIPNPYQTLQAIDAGYRVVGMAGEPADFKGVFVVRADSGITRPTDLKGKSVSYPSPTALAACIMPQAFLQAHGVNVSADLQNLYVGSQESSIMNVWLGKTAAGATWPTPWRAFQKEHPKEASELKVAWETEPLVNNSFMARDDLPSELVEQVRGLLLGLDATSEGPVILAGMETARFLPATNADYDVVREYLARFEREVRPVEKP